MLRIRTYPAAVIVLLFLAAPVLSQNIITTVAGGGTFSGEGVPATQAALQGPTRVALDAAGNLYIADTTNNRVRKVAPNGVITTFAGAGAPGDAGDGGPATRALLNLPTGVAVDAAGNVYISEGVRVRKVDASGIITAFAGSGLSPSQGAGDGGPATQAAFNSIYDLDFDRFGNLYIADPLAGSIRKVTPGGIITTVATSLLFPMAVTAGPDGALYVPTQALSYARRDGGITRIAPDGTRTSAVPQLIRPGKPAVDAAGAIYFTDSACYDIPPGCANVVTKRVGGANTVIAGTGEAAYGGDGGPATAAALNQPLAVKLDALGNLYVVDTGNNRIRRIFLNAASGLPEPAMTIHLAPGFYIAEVTLGEGEPEGYWGMEALAPKGTLAGGFNLGGAIQERRLPPGFGAFYLPSAQVVNLQLNAQVLPGWDASKAGVGIRILDAQRRPVGAERFGVNAVEFQQQLDAGFYIVEVRGGDSGPRATFQLGLNSVAFAGGVDAGGFVTAGITGFGAFFIPEEQDVTIHVLGRPSYGTDGAGALRLTLRDANRALIRTVP
jgi:sugar lactone lactonase YvrE